MDEDGHPISPYPDSEGGNERPDSARPSTSRGRGRRKKESKYPKGELDDRHLYAVSY